MGEWQPIESAPAYTDGCEVVLVARRNGDGKVIYDLIKPDGDWWRAERAKGRLKFYLGWQPITPPQQQAEADLPASQAGDL